MSWQAMEWAMKHVPMPRWDASAHVVLTYLAYRAQPDGTAAYPSVDTIAEDLGAHVDVVRRALRRLQTYDVVSKDGTGDRGQVCWRLHVERSRDADSDERRRRERALRTARQARWRARTRADDDPVSGGDAESSGTDVDGPNAVYPAPVDDAHTVYVDATNAVYDASDTTSVDGTHASCRRHKRINVDGTHAPQTVLTTDQGNSPGRAHADTTTDVDGTHTVYTVNGATAPPAAGDDEPSTRTPPSDDTHHATTTTHSSRRDRRGTRVPEPFVITTAMREWAHTTTPDVDLDWHTAQFVDYWADKAGKDACKLDWTRTWKRWMRTEQSKQPTRGRRNGASTSPAPADPSTHDPHAEPVAWLRDLWHAGMVGPIERLTGMTYPEPDLPLDVRTRAEVDAFHLEHRREWINTHHTEILNTLGDTPA